MPDEQPGMQLGFSLQPGPDGKPAFIGVHWETPMATYALLLPPEWAEMLIDEFPRQLRQMLNQLKTASNPLVVAPASTLDTLKGNNR